jgi:short-subunit dehydrogenase
MELDNRKLLVTGASRGIGQAITQRLLQGGAEIIGIGRDFSNWNGIPEGLSPVELDLSQLDSLPQQLKTISSEHPAIDGIVCCAGFGRFGSLEEFSPQQIRELIDLNLTSQILLTRTFLPQLKNRGQGDLIFMGSEAALTGGRRGAVYCATKFGLRGLAQSLREECAGSGIRISIINPGMVKTGFFDNLTFRPGEAEENYLLPEDVAEAVYGVLTARPGTCFDEINLSPLKKVVQFRKPPK